MPSTRPRKYVPPSQSIRAKRLRVLAQSQERPCVCRALKPSVVAMAVPMLLESVILAGIAPLVGTAMAEHVREVMMVEVNPVAVAVKVPPVRLTVHEDLH